MRGGRLSEEKCRDEYLSHTFDDPRVRIRKLSREAGSIPTRTKGRTKEAAARSREKESYQHLMTPDMQPRRLSAIESPFSYENTYTSPRDRVQQSRRRNERSKVYLSTTARYLPNRHSACNIDHSSPLCQKMRTPNFEAGPSAHLSQDVYQYVPKQTKRKQTTPRLPLKQVNNIPCILDFLIGRKKPKSQTLREERPLETYRMHKRSDAIHLLPRVDSERNSYNKRKSDKKGRMLSYKVDYEKTTR